MANVLNISNFDAGVSKINHNGYQSSNLQWYIDKYEKQFLIELLGVTTYNAFIADLANGVPVTPKFQVIYEPLAVEISNNNVVSRGMIEMLKGFVYFFYVRDNMFKQTPTGQKSNDSDNSTNVSGITSNIQGRFNDSVDDFKTIQYYIKDNKTDYPDYNGKNLDYALPI